MKSCPFCGGKVTAFQGHADFTYFSCGDPAHKTIDIGCCGAMFSFRDNYAGGLRGSAAIAAFERRHDSEAAERALASMTEHAERCASLLKLEAARTEQLQQERDRLAARLDAAEKLAVDIQGGFLPNIWQYTDDMHVDLQDEVSALSDQVNKMVDALSSSPSTSAVAEGEK